MSRLLALVLLVVACDKAPPPAAQADAATKAPAAKTPDAKRPEVVPEPPPPEVAGELHYIVRYAGGAKETDTLPMIVTIHGLGDDPENFVTLFAEFPEPARIVAVRGVDETEGGGWSWFPRRARDPDVEALAEGIKASAEKIATATQVLVEKYPTKGKPIVTGFSQGGMLSFTLAAHHPAVYSASVPVGGWLPPPLWITEKGAGLPKIVALHGTDDAAVIYEPTKASVDNLKTLGYDAELKSYEGVGHVITDEIRRDLFDALVDAVKRAK